MSVLIQQWTSLLLSLAVATAQTNYFGSTYTGDGTYYGDQSGAGHCSFQFSNSYTLPWTTGVYTGVAVNAPQYANSQPCGMCIAFWGTGPGSGANPISSTVQYAIATDECPECLSGSLDLAQDGDGRWTIDWYPVQCDVGDSFFQYSFQGSVATYVKMAITNTRVPISAVSIASPDGTMDAMARSVDNYWIADSGTYTFPAAVSITSVFGDTVTDTVNVASPTGAVTGKAQFPLSAAYEVVGGASSTSTSPTAEATPAATTPAATTAATMAPTPEPTAVPTAVPTPEPTTEPTTAATTEPTAEPTTEPTAEPAAEPTATAVAASPPPPYLSATANYSVNTSAPAPPVPASAEVTPVPIVVPASTETASAVVSNVTTAVTPSSTAAAAPQASNPDGDNSLVPTPASCTLSVAALQQCGGRGGVCANQATNGTQCADAQWGNACCTSGYYCQRQQQWSWTCQRSEVPGADTSVSSGGTVADYKQCGGLGNCVESLCADAQWENYSCYDGFTCLRWDAFYWQCRDIPFAELA